MKRKQPHDAAAGRSGDRAPREVELRLFEIAVEARGVGVVELEEIDALEQGRAFYKKIATVQLNEDVARVDVGAGGYGDKDCPAAELREDFKDCRPGERGVDTKKKNTKAQKHKDGFHG